jgi:hypothetical protein
VQSIANGQGGQHEGLSDRLRYADARPPGRWHGTKIEAAYACKRLVDDGFTPSAKPVSIPTEKANLIRWLNVNFHSDNG